MIKTTAPIVKTIDQQRLDVFGAKYQNDLPRLLRPWLSFRIFFKFRKAFIQEEGLHKGKRKDTVHRYGYENNCTYSQCVNGHVDVILLDKRKGFDACALLAEYTFRDKFNLAQIYTRSVCPDGKFDILLRQYNSKGEIVTVGKDLEGKEDLIKQMIQPENNRTLFFFKDNNDFIQLSETPVPSPQEFHELVTQSLNT
jgi:hypothetical protein